MGEAGRLRARAHRRRTATRGRSAQRRSELEVFGDLLDVAGDVSHDLRAPLRSMQGYAAFLLEDYGDRLDAQGQALLRGLADVSRRLDARVEALGHLAKLRHGKLADELVDLQAALTEARVGVDLSGLVVPRPLPTVRGDRARLGELFGHLLRNARTYTERPEPRVEVLWDEVPGGLRVRVRDDGIGVPPAHREAVFRLFRRLHERDAYGGGTGAGLTFAREIVARHGGRIALEDGPPGTTVAFTLPRR
jgi:signal transduction histidine kinase